MADDNPLHTEAPLTSSGWSNTKLARLMRMQGGRPLGVLVMLGLIALYYVAEGVREGPVTEVRRFVFDSYQRLLPRERVSAPVVIVAIDEKALARYGQWPWPRDITARLLQKIAAYQPAVIGVDIIMPEPDRRSPENADWLDAAPHSLQEWMKSREGNDVLLGRALRTLPVVLGVGGSDEAVELEGPLALFQLHGVDPEPWLVRFSGMIRSVPEIDLAAAGHGMLNALPDRDGVIRRVPVAGVLANRLAPSLDLEMLRIAIGANWVDLYGDEDGLTKVAVGDLTIPVQSDGTIWVHFTYSDGTRFVSAADVLDGNLHPDVLGSRIVYLGVTGLGLQDQRTVPIAPRMSGVEVRAQLLENIFDDAILKRPRWAIYVEFGLMMLCAGAMVMLVPAISPGYTPLPWAVFSGGLAVGGMAAYSHQLLLIDIGLPIVGTSLVSAFMLTINLMESDHHRRLFKRDLEIQRQREAKLAGELDAARRIQMGILPDTDAISDSAARFDIHAMLEPAKEVGGDLYDAFPIGDNHLFFLVGDVAGKGIPASLFMALGKSLYKSAVLRRRTDVAAIMTEANAEIARDNPAMLFITAYAGLLDLETGTVALCNAGHDDPFLLSSEGKVSQISGPGGPPLCVLDDFEFPGFTFQLATGDCLLMTTDGVSEAMNNARELYGNEATESCLSKAEPEIPVKALVDRLYRDVKRHADGADPSDDITILAVRWNGPRQVTLAAL
ncbi:MAG: CHASE2 domain-containing protein [Magnetospiraceae bacterium]